MPHALCAMRVFVPAFPLRPTWPPRDLENASTFKPMFDGQQHMARDPQVVLEPMSPPSYITFQKERLNMNSVPEIRRKFLWRLLWIEACFVLR